MITGIGGAGKTAAVASFAYNESETTWLSGPTDTQIQGLKKVANKGIGKSKEDLLNYILGGKPISYTVKKKKGIDGRSIISIDSQDLNTTNTPKHLIIDEATHFSNAELQIISQWARKAGVRLTLIGDENQKGNAV
jgi:DNA transposition AAA+ family ATPase